MTGKELLQTLSSACVVFLYPMDGQTKIWTGVYIAPHLIATVLHPFTSTGDSVPKENVLNLNNLHIVNIDGKRLTIKDFKIMPTGDNVLIEVEEEGSYILPHPYPLSIPKDSLIYSWAYMESVESPLVGAMQGKTVYEKELRLPYWGLWSVGWWQGPITTGGQLSAKGDDYWVYMPSVKGQSGSPFITLNPPYVVGLLRATFSTEEGSLLETAKTYITSIEHITQEVTARITKEEEIPLKLPTDNPYLVLAIGVGAGIILYSLMS